MQHAYVLDLQLNCCVLTCKYTCCVNHGYVLLEIHVVMLLDIVIAHTFVDLLYAHFLSLQSAHAQANSLVSGLRL